MFWCFCFYSHFFQIVCSSTSSLTCRSHSSIIFTQEAFASSFSSLHWLFKELIYWLFKECCLTSRCCNFFLLTTSLLLNLFHGFSFEANYSDGVMETIIYRYNTLCIYNSNQCWTPNETVEHILTIGCWTTWHNCTSNVRTQLNNRLLGIWWLMKDYTIVIIMGKISQGMGNWGGVKEILDPMQLYHNLKISN